MALRDLVRPGFSDARSTCRKCRFAAAHCTVDNQHDDICTSVTTTIVCTIIHVLQFEHNRITFQIFLHVRALTCVVELQALGLGAAEADSPEWHGTLL